MRIVKPLLTSGGIRASLRVPVRPLRASKAVALLAICLAISTPVLVSDDEPLRNGCKALSVPVSGSIGVLIRSVERGDLSAEAARDSLYAMDAVGARLSASLIRRAERLIGEAAGE